MGSRGACVGGGQLGSRRSASHRKNFVGECVQAPETSPLTHAPYRTSPTFPHRQSVAVKARRVAFANS